MFSEYQPHEHHRKRHREEDDAGMSGGPVGFTEHRNKRLHSLPVRTSPHSRRWIDPPAFSAFARPASAQIVTPVEPIPEQRMWADEPELIHGNQPAIMDMDMMDTSEPTYAQDQTATEGQLSVPSVTGRIPTPIHCSFAAQVRGNSWGSGMTPGDVLATTPEEPNASAFHNNGLVDLGSQQLCRPPQPVQVMADWSMVQENRRLPSPISECGGEESPH